jgi:hypothetical protein
MHRILLNLVIFLFSSFLANAQFNKGSILLGGQISYSYNSYSDKIASFPPGYDQKANTADFNISVGKAVKENTVVGIILTYSPYSANNYSAFGLNGPLRYQDNSYTIGIFYRKYKSLGKDFFLFGEAGASYSGSSISAKDSTGNKVLTGSGNGGTINLFPGISYKVSKKFFLDISIPSLIFAQYSKTNISSQSETSKSDQLRISTSLNSGLLSDLAIGFRLDL